MLIKNPEKIDRQAVGCICTYEGKYFLVRRIKDEVWNSVTGNVEQGESFKQAIVRELREEIGFEGITPEFITTFYHDYGGKVVEYGLFTYDFKENPLKKIKA